MSDKVTVKFKIKDGKYDMEKGRWCKLCKWVMTQGIKRTLLISVGPGSTSTSSNCTACAELFIKDQTRHVACIFISITTSTRKGVKKQTYLSTIGRFHRTFGESWRRRKRRRNAVEWAKRRSSSCWTSGKWLGRTSSQERMSSRQSQPSSQLTIKWVNSTHHEYQNKS